MSKKIASLTLILVLLILYLRQGATAAPDANIVVDSTFDSQINDGVCTLREAILNANGDNQTGSTDCAAGSGEDTITFSVATPVTIPLSDQLPDVTSVITITGPGPEASSLVLSGGGSVRVLAIQNAGSLGLDTVTIANGFSSEGGGGVLNFGGKVNISNSTFSGNNAEEDGGGLLNEELGMMTITNSTFSGNGAVKDGGALYNNNGVVTITNSTFSGNSAEGDGDALYTNKGVVTITSSTFTNNDEEALHSKANGIINLSNTIVSNNLGGQCDDYFDGGGNLIEDGLCGFPIGGDPLLGPLADNGGSTLTHALLPGSPALDTANLDNCPETDQRGIPRPLGEGCDIGAFEVVPKISLPIVLFTLPTLPPCFAGPMEQEDNDTASTANGLLCASGTFTGFPNDEWDVFSFKTATSGQITIDLTNFTGTNVQLQLLNENLQIACASPGCFDTEFPYHNEYSNAPAGLYYIAIHIGNPGSYNSDTHYSLIVSFP